jgi:hypothetical protein
MMVMTIEIKNRIEKNVPIITSIDRENFLKENCNTKLLISLCICHNKILFTKLAILAYFKNNNVAM